MQKSWLPPGGKNLFQEIKAKRAEAESRGIEIVNMSIGQPQGPALQAARIGAAQAVLSHEEAMHEYQDNGTPGIPDFAERFVRAHGELSPAYPYEFLPIPGIKPMLGLVIMACDSTNNSDLAVATTTNPGYPTPKTWCDYLGVKNYELPTNAENGFLFSVEDIPEDVDLLHINYPHNPSGAIATKAFWENLCGYCAEKGIRIFNDAAYSLLAYTTEVCLLSSVAPAYSKLSWAEAFSASKVIGNGTGWRIGAIAGSPDFVGDIATVKGNTDSGPFAPAPCGVMYCLDYDRESVEEVAERYYQRAMDLMKTLWDCGMEEAVYPGAGFFTLWKAPTRAFGQKIGSGEEFNYLMIEKTGVMGVHFGPYIRYAVVGPTEEKETREKIASAFVRAGVSYD